ncbi:Ubiquitin-like modifier hub1 [Fusarium austroafricanum]|uniref:Ubiquitin-like modifier HUB1 n=1 Tax=Fusarium austroafricanum TaxID=2364996 RepID=A0A8H4KRV7_9HYPO|nr:Ubiquitin-like modifier hub1 [Fusarium austroafricanum]
MTNSPPTEPRARSKSPAPREKDDRRGRDDTSRENSERRHRRDRSWSRDRNNNSDRRDSPPRRPRDRSRSPARRPRGSGGFKWKGERRDNDRNRDFRRRSPRRHRDRDYGRDRNYRRDDRDGGRDRQRDGNRDQRGERKEKKEEKPKAPVAQQGGEEMIIVNVNDRLGTKAAVPCLESDTVGQLKMMVAARIGRDPGQIILKRQSERPFKDHITLRDYGISNGVQLDLEIDTRD